MHVKIKGQVIIWHVSVKLSYKINLDLWWVAVLKGEL